MPFGEYMPLSELAAARQDHPRQHRSERRPGTADDRAAGACRLFADHLLRGDLPRRGRRCARAPGLDSQRHQRCVVRPQLRALPAFRDRPDPRRSRKGCRWSASPITASAASSTPRGGCVARTGLDSVGHADVPLPAALPPTLYAAAGDWLFAALLLLVHRCRHCRAGVRARRREPRISPIISCRAPLTAYYRMSYHSPLSP